VRAVGDTKNGDSAVVVKSASQSIRSSIVVVTREGKEIVGAVVRAGLISSVLCIRAGASYGELSAVVGASISTLTISVGGSMGAVNQGLSSNSNLNMV